MAVRYSNSRINSFSICPRQYKFQYIERAAVEKPVGVETALGNAVHKALESLYNMKMNGRTPSKEEILQIYSDYWEGPDRDKIKVTRDNLDVDDYIKMGEEAIGKFYDKYKPFDDGDTIDLERKLSFPLDPRGKFSISGVIDRIVKRHDGVIEIIDYKTGSRLPTQEALDNDVQMALYHLGIQHMWPDFKDVEIKQIFLRPCIELKTRFRPEKLEEIRYNTFQKILEIEQARKEDDFPPKESTICDWCVYYELCPAKRHKLALEEEITVDFSPERGKELANEYLKLDQEIKERKSRMDALKDDLKLYSEETELTKLEGDHGHIKISVREYETFPTKTDDEDSYNDISLLVRNAGIEECFKLDPNLLFKEFYVREKLPDDLAEQLRSFIRSKKQYRFNVKYEGD